MLSLIGTSMQNTALPLLAYRLSGRPLDLGLIGFASALPTFFLAIPGGVVVEHLDKRRAVIGAQVVMMLNALVLAILTLRGVIETWHIVLFSLVLGIAIAFEIPARQSMLIELVGRDALPNAIALQSTGFNLSRILGPALVAPVLLTFPENGEGGIFLINTISFLSIIIGLFFVRTRYRSAIEPTPVALLPELKEGARYLRRSAAVGLLILTAGTFGLLAFPIIQQLPVVSQDLLRQAGDTKATVDARNSLLYGAQGAGALIASFSLAMNSAARVSEGRLRAGQGAFIFAMVLLPFARLPALSALLVAAMGWGAVTMMATMNTLIQLAVPDGLRGRIFGIYLWALQGTAPFGSLLVGWMTQRWNLPVTTVICGALCALVAAGIQRSRARSLSLGA